VSEQLPSADAGEGCQEPFICPLSQVRVGTACRIRQLCAAPEVAHRLRELGFCEEQRIKLLSQHANVICQVCNVRLGISAELAEAIWVEPLPPAELVA
jgi:Fe2+ transport system protein FeoA